jgi:hypothetical protein
MPPSVSVPNALDVVPQPFLVLTACPLDKEVKEGIFFFQVSNFRTG